MILSDRDIVWSVNRGNIKIEPFDPAAIQPASYDVRLGHTLLRWWGDAINPERDQSAQWRSIPLTDDGRWLLYPGALYLGVTLESVSVPNDLLCHLHGRSSLGRLGIQIHTTAGLVDPGWVGKLTLEITVQAGPTWLRPGMPIGQLTFQEMVTESEHPYRGRYRKDVDPTPSRLWQQQEVAP